LDNAESDGELMMDATAVDMSGLTTASALMYAKVNESTRRLTGNLLSAGAGVVGTTGTAGVCCSFFLQAVKKRKTKKTNTNEQNLCFIAIFMIPKIKKRHMKFSCAWKNKLFSSASPDFEPDWD